MTEGAPRGPIPCGLLLFLVWVAFETWSEFPFLPCFPPNMLAMEEGRWERRASGSREERGEASPSGQRSEKQPLPER